MFARQVTIPPRPYLGLSGENADDIEGLLLIFIGRLLS